MDYHTEVDQHPDFGVGEKKLGIYLVGFVLCCILTLISFGSIMWFHFSKMAILITIFATAIIQFLVQLIFFLRLHLQTHQGKANVMTFVFTGVILLSIVIGSLWIMWSLNYHM